MTTLTPKVISRFYDLSIPEPNSGCWLWLGSIIREKKPYGRFSIGRQMWIASRASYFIHFGEFDRALWVLHKCDNPMCVNPEHLYLGNGIQNAHDRNERERQARGSTIGTSKLTEADVREIRTSTKTWAALAKIYGMNRNHIGQVKNRKLWLHVE